MKCPWCGGKLKVEECATDYNHVYRRRICLECHRLHWAMESAADPSEVENEIRRIRREHNTMNKREKRHARKKIAE